MITEQKPDKETATNEPPSEMIELLGKVSDLQLHYRFNWNYKKIHQLRKSLAIAPFKAPKAAPAPTNEVVDVESFEWWSTAEAAAAWGVTYSESIHLVVTIPGLVRRNGNRIKVRKGTPKPRMVNGAAPGNGDPSEQP